MKTTTSLVIALGLAATSLAHAEKKPDAPKPGKPAPAKVFQKKDADGDGFLSKEEFVKGAKDADRAGKAFGRKDKDGDGKLSKEEFAAKPQGGGKKKKKEEG